MPAIGNIVINDGAATPVAHTFAPDGIKGDVAAFADRSGGISIGYPRITISSLVPTGKNRFFKVQAKVVLPVLETQSGTASNGFTPAPQKAYDLTAHMTFLLPERSTQQNRKDLLAFVKNFLAHATPTAVIQDNDAIY